jgi:transposase-like protein
MYTNFLFSQVLYRDTSIPIFGALMTRKTEALYEAVFQRIAEYWPEFQPTHLMSDFERALQTSIMKTWPDAIIRGCRFHFAQACQRQIGKKKLTRDFRMNARVKDWLTAIYGLCLLPPYSIPAVWNHHRSKLSEFAGNAALLKRLKKYESYVEKFWMQRVTPSIFSVFGLLHKTNNHAESLNARLRRDFKVCHPGFWKFMSLYVKSVINWTTDDLAVLREGRQPRRERRPDEQSAQ